MSKASVWLHFRHLIAFLTVAVVCLWIIYMCNLLVPTLRSNDSLVSSNPSEWTEIADLLERYNTNSFSSVEKLQGFRMISNEVEENETIGSQIDGDKILERKGNVKRKNTQFSPYVISNLHLSITDHMKNKTILFWNPPVWLKVYANFNTDLCVYKNCRITFNRNYFGISDAVVYSLIDIGMGKTPPVQTHMRNPDQVWIFFTLEPPVAERTAGRDFMNQEWQDVFNWSWTYRTDADIFQPYGTLVTKDKVPERNYSAIFRKKTKFATWGVSHCETPSEREKYVELLKQYVNVDIYGRCGRKGPPDLTGLFSNNYKFYLGFENALCNGYITEKFFFYYQMDIINIVRGKGDYSRYLPKGSFINTADFPSVKALAKFILELGSNEEEYIKYLKIKDKYKVYEVEYTYRDALCTVCEKLNNIEMHRKTHPSLNDWLNSCFAANDLK